MFYSGLVVKAAPGKFDEALASVSALPCAEIFQQHRDTSRFVVVLEDESVHKEADAFTRIRTLPGVADVSLIAHREDA